MIEQPPPLWLLVAMSLMVLAFVVSIMYYDLVYRGSNG
jgi:hypothetical protein